MVASCAGCAINIQRHILCADIDTTLLNLVERIDFCMSSGNSTNASDWLPMSVDPVNLLPIDFHYRE